MSGAHPGGIQPEHSPRTVLCSSSCCGAEPFPVHSFEFFLVTLMLRLRAPDVLRALPFQLCRSKQLWKSSGLCVDGCFLCKAAWRARHAAGAGILYLHSFLPSWDSWASAWIVPLNAAPTALPSCSLCLPGAAVSCGIPALHRAPGIAAEGQHSLQSLSTTISCSFS